ncbi:MAG: hypothetical protein E6H46_15130 [Betaproteobacteria bacterium]|nr:MAG: hypothetical protein E6H46_15130 [Betaproteobacteria bacterium]
MEQFVSSSTRKIGIIGVGFGAQVHVPGFRSEGWEVAAICSRNREKAQKAGAEAGIDGIYTDPMEIIRTMRSRLPRSKQANTSCARSPSPSMQGKPRKCWTSLKNPGGRPWSRTSFATRRSAPTSSNSWTTATSANSSFAL